MNRFYSINNKKELIWLFFQLSAVMSPPATMPKISNAAAAAAQQHRGGSGGGSGGGPTVTSTPQVMTEQHTTPGSDTGR